MEDKNQKIFHLIPKEITGKFFNKKNHFVLYDIKNEKIINDHLSTKNIFSINLKSDKKNNLRGGERNFDKHFNFLSIDGNKIFVKDESWNYLLKWKLLQDLENSLFKYISNPFRDIANDTNKNYSLATLISFSNDELSNLIKEETKIINENFSIKTKDEINDYAITLDKKYREHLNINLLQVFFMFSYSLQIYKKYLKKEINLINFYINLYPYIFLNKDNFFKNVKEEMKKPLIEMNVEKKFDEFEKLLEFNFLTKICFYHSTEKNDKYLRIYHLNLLGIFRFENLKIVRSLFNPLGEELYIFYNKKEISEEEAYDELEKYFFEIIKEYKSFEKYHNVYILARDLYLCKKYDNDYVYIEKEKFEKIGLKTIKEYFKIK